MCVSYILQYSYNSLFISGTIICVFSRSACSTSVRDFVFSVEHLQEFPKFYLTNLVFCQLLKDMPSKKGVHLEQFDIIHLPNSNLTYISNPER
jgi:hypothetical protein